MHGCLVTYARPKHMRIFERVQKYHYARTHINLCASMQTNRRSCVSTTVVLNIGAGGVAYKIQGRRFSIENAGFRLSYESNRQFACSKVVRLHTP